MIQQHLWRGVANSNENVRSPRLGREGFFRKAAKVLLEKIWTELLIRGQLQLSVNINSKARKCSHGTVRFLSCNAQYQGRSLVGTELDGTWAFAPLEVDMQGFANVPI